MPEVGPQFTSPEEEIATLERRLAEKRAELLAQEEGKIEREETRPNAAEREGLRREIERHVAHTPQPSVQVQKDAADSLRGVSRQQQVTMLVELALEKGIVHAVKIAEELDDPYLLDRLHDELVDHFYEKLVQSKGELRDI